MTKLEIFKKVVKWIVGLSTGWTVGNVIGNNVTPENRRHKAEAVIAGGVIGAIVAEHSEAWIDKQIDETVEQIKKLKKDASQS